MTITINSDRLDQSRISASLSLRSHANAAGINLNILTRLLDTGDATHLSVRDLAAVARAVGLRINDLFAEPPTDQATTSADVAAEIVSALLDHRGGLPATALANASGSGADSEAELLDQLTSLLRPVGLTVTLDRTNLVLSALPRTRLTDTILEEAQKQHGRARLSESEIRLVHTAMLGTLPAKVLNNTRADRYLKTRHLQRTGIITEQRRGERSLHLTDRVRYSLLIN